MAIEPSSSVETDTRTNEINPTPDHIETNNETMPPTFCSAPADGAVDGIPISTNEPASAEANNKHRSTSPSPGRTGPKKTTIAVQWNLRGLAVRSSELRQLLEEHQPVVVALQEIKTKKRKDTDKLDRDRYDWRFCFKPSDGFSSGVALGVDKTVPHRYLDVRGPLQVVAARVEWPTAATFASIYICREDGKAEIEDKLDQLIPQLPAPIVLLGDFNAHSPLWGGNHRDQRGRAIEQILGKYNLIILNDGRHTRIDPRDGRSSAIDLSVVSDTIAPELTWSVDVDTRESDHYPLFVHSVDHTRVKRTRRPRWQYEKADWSKFAKEISRTNPENAHQIEQAIVKAAEASIPQTSTKTGRKAVHWWSKEVEEAVKDRRKKLRHLRKMDDNHPNKGQALAAFKEARNTARKTIAKARTDSWTTFVTGISPSSSTSEIWRRVNAFRNGPKVSIHQLVIDGRLVDEPVEVAEALADHFAEVSAAKAPTHRRAVPDELIPTFEGEDQERYNQDFGMEELDWAIRKSKGLSAGVDNIGYPMIRNLPYSSKVQLLAIFNQTWRNGNIPQRWKEGIVVPIPKAGKDYQFIGNQRPITLVSCLGKVLERMVNRRIITTLEELGVLGDDQHGFRRGKGVDTYLAELEDEIEDWIGKRQHGELAMLDLAKAYDTAERIPILHNLQRWGIRGRMGRFIADFLRERTFRVAIGNLLSTLRVMESGVPQGTILAVTLFLVRMTEVKRYIPKGVGLKLYADDILLFAHGKSAVYVRKKIQEAVANVETWTQFLGFELASTKSSIIHICRRNRHEERNPVLTEAGEIQNVKHARLLGATFDGRFNHRQHISETKENIECRNRILRVIGGHRISGARGTLLDVHRAIVQSRLFYAWGMISSATPAAIRPLGPAHVAGIRSASGAFRSSPCKAIYAESGQLPFEHAATVVTVTKAVSLAAGGTIGPHHSLSKRAKEDFNRITRLELPDVERKLRIGDRPWHVEKPKVDWEMTAYVRAGESSQKAKAAFGVVSAKYTEHHKIFTDGSKDDDFTGCGIVDGTDRMAIRLPAQCSIFSAEAHAIATALKRIPEGSATPSVIFTDSASVVEAVENGISHHPWIQEIEAEMARTNATLCWIPGHCGIAGNEMADQTAKAAKLRQNVISPVPAQDILLWAKNAIRLAWEREWHSERDLHLRRVKPNTMPGTDRPSQEEQRALTRLRIGHTRLTHEGLFRGERAMCDTCGVPLTVEHIICSCRKFDQHRDDTACNIYGALNNDPEAERKLLLYLRNTKLLEQI